LKVGGVKLGGVKVGGVKVGFVKVGGWVGGCMDALAGKY